MSRLIDADYVLKALGIFNNKQNGNEHFLNGIETAKEIVQDAPTIEAEPARWINMDEDEPPLGQKVLVYRAQKPVEIMSMLYLDNEYWWRNNVDEIFKVYDNDYWMPLPEPTKEVEIG